MAEEYEEFRVEYAYEWLRNQDPPQTTWTSPTRTLDDAYAWLYQYFQGQRLSTYRVQRRTVTISDWEAD